MIPELKPCPFCGSEPVVLRTKNRRYPEIVLCLGCYSSSGGYTNTREAIEAWNNRYDCSKEEEAHP